MARTVRVIPATKAPVQQRQTSLRQLRVAAYCRVSTKEEEQLNSYAVQVSHYTERIQQEPNWTLAGIFGDRGISGTSVKRRDEFNKMIAKCKRGKIDMIITKSISRFARNTVDCLKYKGDLVINKTYTVDCLTKEVRVNDGERAKYYVSNNHPAIIDSATFGRVQEELARRSSKTKVKLVGTKTEQGKYCGKYALTELLICGECHTPYRRCVWTDRGEKKPVWRCINRLDYGR